MTISLHKMNREQLLTVIAASAATLAGHDLFPIDLEDKALLEKRLQIASDILDEENDANRFLIDTLSDENNALTKWADSYRDNNPYKLYADYRDNYDDSPELLQKLLECATDDDVQQWFCDQMSKWEDNAMNHNSTGDMKYYWEAAWSDHWDGSKGFESKPDWDVFYEYLTSMDLWLYYDASDAVKTALRSTNAKVVATPHLANGDAIFCPHYEQGNDDNKDCINILNRLFDMGLKISTPQDWADATYSGSRMIFMGDLDWLDIVETRKVPNKLTVSKNENYVFHDSFNGSGSCRESAIRRTVVTVRAKFHLDKTRRYGVDETYGFVSSVWRDELAATHQVWADDVEALTQDKNGKVRKLKVK